MQRNEWLDINAETQKEPYKPVRRNEPGEGPDYETDEEFDWFEATEDTEKTYFNLVNKNRKTFKQGE